MTRMFFNVRSLFVYVCIFFINICNRAMILDVKFVQTQRFKKISKTYCF